MKNCWKHDWSKWEEFSKPTIVSLKWPQPPEGQTYIDKKQRRTCLKCGYTQEETLD